MLNFEKYYNILCEKNTENILSESFDIEMLNIFSSHTERIKYAKRYLPLLGNGSGRVVFKYGEDKVIKIAKNDYEGMQNRDEVKIFENVKNISDSKIIANVLHVGENFNWIVSEYGKRMSYKRFEELTKFSLIKLRNDRGSYKYESYIRSKNKFAAHLLSFVEGYDINDSDILRVDSYGEINRRGKPSVILVDYGRL